jgi:hypothetical protein
MQVYRMYYNFFGAIGMEEGIEKQAFPTLGSFPTLGEG